MAPQYGFKLKTNDLSLVNKFSRDLKKFITSIGMYSKIDIMENSVVMTIDPAGDLEFQKYNLSKAKQKFKNLGFKFTKIEDHHSGAHSEFGTLATINASNNLSKIIKKRSGNDEKINYLEFTKAITEYFLKT